MQKAKRTYLHIPGVKVTADFSTEDGVLYRYRLEIIKEEVPVGRTVCVVMQNPSYAGESDADKSVQFLEKVIFTQGLPEFVGVHRLIVVNQFAKVQTENFEGLALDIGSRNNEAVEQAIMESDIVLIGWGASNRYLSRQGFVMKILGSLTDKTLYRTSKHPSRGQYDGFIRPIDVDLVGCVNDI